MTTARFAFDTSSGSHHDRSGTRIQASGFRNDRRIEGEGTGFDPRLVVEVGR